MDAMALQDEKVSYIKEQIKIWKIRACRVEERVTRLLVVKEQEIKATYDMKSESEKEEQGSSSIQDDLPPEIAHYRRAGRRARL